MLRRLPLPWPLSSYCVSRTTNCKKTNETVFSNLETKKIVVPIIDDARDDVLRGHRIFTVDLLEFAQSFRYFVRIASVDIGLVRRVTVNNGCDFEMVHQIHRHSVRCTDHYLVHVLKTKACERAREIDLFLRDRRGH